MTDRLKADVAAAIQRAVHHECNATRYVAADPNASLTGKPVDDNGVAEVQDVDDLNTIVRVRTPHGPRYFRVKVSEQY